MTVKTYTAFYSPYGLREYEKELFNQELRALVEDANVLTQCTDGVTFTTADVNVVTKLRKLTFCSDFRCGDSSYSTKQRTVETSNGSSTKSRNLRYFGHGIHEYKGRFYPQLARCLMQVVGANEKKIGLDPFCGSGTLLYEAELNDYMAVGFDINPVAQLIANAKLQSIFFNARDLEDMREKVEAYEEKYEVPPLDISNRHWDYLLNWFPQRNLTELIQLSQFIGSQFKAKIAQYLRVVLSDMLRDFSWQCPDEQRTRRRKDAPLTDVVTQFQKRVNLEIDKLDSLRNSLKSTRYKNRSVALRGDARHLPLSRNSIDFIVTSPPYATALPYIDADRLSMFFFDLVCKEEFNSLGKNSIGNREISSKERQRLEQECSNAVNLNNFPPEIISLVERISEENQSVSVGFRRRNLPALLFKYFSDMFSVCKDMSRVLKVGSRAALVIGNNFTIAGGQRLDIPTSDLVTILATNSRLNLVDRIPFEPPRSYTIYSRNAVKCESVLLFEAV